MDPTGPVSAPVEDTVYREDNGLAPVGQPVYLAVQDAVLDDPLAEPEDARENVPFDPLEARVGHFLKKLEIQVGRYELVLHMHPVAQRKKN